MRVKAVVFLDIDGVLNHEEFYLRRGTREQYLNVKHSLVTFEDKVRYKMDNLCSESIAQVARILTACDAGIVLSSSWRGTDYAEEALRRMLPLWDERYCGRTAQLSFCQRGIEVQDWIVKNDFRKPFAILDDDADLAPFMDHLFQTNTKRGLTAAIADRVIEYLLALTAEQKDSS